MSDSNIIHYAITKLAEVYNPIAIYLFGSHAWGTINENSDYDFLIIVEDIKKFSKPYSLLGVKALRDLSVPKDILIAQKDEFLKLSKDNSSLYSKIKNQARLLYGTI